MIHLRASDLFTTEVDGSTVVLDARSSRYLSTNPSGSLMLEALRTGATMDDLAALLRAEFGVDEATAVSDSLAFVESLRSHGLLEEG